MTPSELFNTDSTLTFGTTNINLTKNISTLFPTLNSEIDNTISISGLNDDLVKTVYRKSDKYNSLYDNSLTICPSPAGGSNVIKYYARNDFPVDDVNITNAIAYGANAENRVYSTGYSGDASSVYNANSGGDLKFIRDIEYNKMLFAVTAKEYSNITVLEKGTIDYTNGSHATPSVTGVDLKDINPNKWYMGYDGIAAKVWNGNGWSDINAHPVLICKGDTVQSIQSAGTAFYSEMANYGMTMGSGQNIGLSVSSTNQMNFGYNFCNALDRSKYTLGWSESFSAAPNWTDIHAAIFTEINQHMIDNSQSSMSCTISREIISISDNMGMLLSVVGQFYRNSNGIYAANISTMMYPMVKGSALLKLLAGFGCYYRADSAMNLSELTPETLSTNSNIWLGAMNADGTTSGTWIKGNDINDYAGYNKDGDINNPVFNPSGGGSGDNDDVEKDMNTVTATGNAGMVTYYEINKTGTATATQISDAVSRFDITTIGKDLIRNLISYKAFAVLPVSNHLLNIIHISGRDLKDENNNDLWGDTVLSLGKISLGTVKVNAMYGDYRDYAPYTKIEMYIPFCGWFSLPSWVIGKTLSGDMWVDLYNGTVKAIVKASSTVVAEVGGCCAYDIPFVAESTGTKAGAVISSALATAGMTAATIATPNIATATAAISSAANLASALNANTTTLKGCLGDGSNINGLNNVWVKITRPTRLDGKKEIPTSYKHECGIPCGKQLTLTAGDGYTQILDANITGAMTDREKQMIIDGFRHGLIL